MRIIAAVLLLATTAGAQTGLVKAFTGAMLIDATDHVPVPTATIVARHGRIVAAAPRARRRIASVWIAGNRVAR